MKMENFLKDSPGKKEKKGKIKEEIKVKEEEDENKEQVNKRIYTLWKTLSAKTGGGGNYFTKRTVKA